jgi:hypothetical protein
VRAAFDAPGPGWPRARYQSPDVMVAASSVDAIARGEYQFVLGELHCGQNTLTTPLFLKEHFYPDELIRDSAIDLGPRIAPVEPKEQARRTDQYSFAAEDIDVEIGGTISRRPRTHVVSVAAWVVEERAGRIEVRTRDQKHRFDLVAFLDHYLVAESSAHFHLLPSAPHTPRVTIDALVIQRESWRFAPAEIPFVRLDTGFDRFSGARRWALATRLPRFLFYRIPEERKPCYLDLESPIYVEIFVKMVRKASAVMVSEMLPTVEQSWLTDGAGRAYTSELRIAALDPERWRP